MKAPLTLTPDVIRQAKSTLNRAIDDLHQLEGRIGNTDREPDEQHLRAHVRGRRFDNAGTDGELQVRIINAETGYYDTFNLATLVALARIGARHGGVR